MPDPLFQQAEIRLTPVSPIHIGSGNKWQSDEIAVTREHYALRDARAFIEAHRDNPAYALECIEAGDPIPEAYTRYTLPAYLSHDLTPESSGGRRRDARDSPRNYRDKRDFEPTFAGLLGNAAGEKTAAPGKSAGSATSGKTEPSPATTEAVISVSEVADFIKDPFERPFVPGSSLKGSLRTALAWFLVKQLSPGDLMQYLPQTPRPGSRPPNRNWASSNLMKFLFGDIQHDLLKALKVSDSNPIVLENALALSQVQVMNLNREGRLFIKRELPLYMESLQPDTEPLHFALTVDCNALRTHLLNPDENRSIHALQQGMGKVLQTPQMLHNLLRLYAQDLLNHEAAFYNRCNATQAERFIQEMLQDPQGIYLPLGHGTGWQSKTVGRALPPDQKDRIRSTFRLGRQQVSEFPKTRKWAYTRRGPVPMGWAKVEIVWK